MHRSTVQRPVLALILSTLLAGTVGAETPAAPQASADKPAIEQKAEVITHEDAGSRIDELRVGGQTRRIDVKTKSSVPAYQVQPLNASPHGDAQGGAGKSSWRLVNF